MADDIDEFWLVEWLRDLFADASAESMYRWMLVAWVLAVGGFILLDRLGSMLAGRSRPRVQTPPALARLWRWRRADAPAMYTALPAGTVFDTGTARQLPPSIQLARSAPIEDAELVILEPELRMPAELEVLEPRMLPAGPIPNDRYWRQAADPKGPAFGLENNVRLELGRAPERYNPITDRIETLEREPVSGIASWPRPEGAVWHGLGLGLEGPAQDEDDDDDEVEVEETEASDDGSDTGSEESDEADDEVLVTDAGGAGDR